MGSVSKVLAIWQKIAIFQDPMMTAKTCLWIQARVIVFYFSTNLAKTNFFELNISRNIDIQYLFEFQAYFQIYDTFYRSCLSVFNWKTSIGIQWRYLLDFWNYAENRSYGGKKYYFLAFLQIYITSNPILFNFSHNVNLIYNYVKLSTT